MGWQLVAVKAVARGMQNPFKGKWDLRKAPGMGEVSTASLTSLLRRRPRGGGTAGAMRVPKRAPGASPCPMPLSPALAACRRLTPKSPLQPVMCLLIQHSISLPFTPGLNHVSWCFLLSYFPEFVPVAFNPPPR